MTMLARLKLPDGWTALLILAVCFATALAATRGEVRPANALGSANAPVTIEFFSDLQCPQCARYEPIVKNLRTEFGDKVRLVLRHFPLDSHQNAAGGPWAAGAGANHGPFLANGGGPFKNPKEVG